MLWTALNRIKILPMISLGRLIVHPLRAPLAWAQREYLPGQQQTWFSLSILHTVCSPCHIIVI